LVNTIDYAGGRLGSVEEDVMKDINELDTGDIAEVVDKTVRVSFDFAEEAYQSLEEMQATIEADSKAEVVRRALGMFCLFLDRTSKGYQPAWEKDDEVEIYEIVW
jgi:hypothetical protein